MIRALSLALALVACDDATVEPVYDLATRDEFVTEGQLCSNGINQLGPCAPGLKCCTVACTVDAGQGCFDREAYCVTNPTPAGFDCP